jgi:hypothetical protein
MHNKELNNQNSRNEQDAQRSGGKPGSFEEVNSVLQY